MNMLVSAVDIAAAAEFVEDRSAELADMLAPAVGAGAAALAAR